MSKGEGRSKSKCFAYVAAFVVFQTAIILVFALTVMKIKSPKVRFGALAVESFSSSNTNSPSFNMRMVTQFTVKNTNFGHFKYDNSTLTVFYGDMPIGEAFIPRGRARARQTRRVLITVDVSSDRLPAGNPNLANDINSGVLNLSSRARLSGKVHLMKVIKKKKSGQMNCNWTINLMTRQVLNLRCR